LLDYRIKECVTKEVDIFKFPVESSFAEDAKKKTVEGKYYYYSYTQKEGGPEPFPLFVFRAFEDSLKSRRGVLVERMIDLGNPSSFITGKIVQENMETWVLMKASGREYQLNIVERRRQVKIVMADTMWNELVKNDSVTLDIFFNDGETTIIPASLPVVEQVCEMMINHPALNLSIQCHTDARGNPVGNSLLSANRAKGVLDALTAKGIEKSRLTSVGWGSHKPVASNSTDEGREKNRRVVIVKK
jgi:outer membrane protein OmpA-like peptidoglycan-associated protein